MKIQVNITDGITPVIKTQRKKLLQLPEQAYKEFVNNTPIRKGNARRNTKLKNKKQIIANYPYAEQLNEGYSKQSPEGMVTPTEEFIINQFNKIMLGK